MFEPRSLEAPHSGAAPAFRTGDRLPRGAYYMLLNTEYFGMPPAADGWVYFRVEGRILRVRARTLEVLGDVTHLFVRGMPPARIRIVIRRFVDSGHKCRDHSGR